MKVRIIGTEREIEVGEHLLRDGLDVTDVHHRQSRNHGTPMAYLQADIPAEAPYLVVTPPFRMKTTIPAEPVEARQVRPTDLVRAEDGGWMRVVRVIPDPVSESTAAVFIDVVPNVRPTRWALKVDALLVRRRLLDRGDWE
ncbi:hypothetical protein O7626_40835 [Micromonospora sp. WMMD1102]|uniref:hypothetical protein n=1 Tax=Micromonospora sp. WMMD1102 TaxID=3016105 RepID=UPI0024152488|nr:hypothetical protein [Micromonospora sp. WMMD1102]MDG4790348.1 hypothetical protein [Micromonospora sp. WMMD1102]MDG4792151.1 hypothetical protein [Micromonospora sp. WMMD1102]